MAKNPAAVFYWNDWENDPELKSCSLAAQGLWMRCLCVAARAPEPGFVQIGSQDCTAASLPAVLARFVGEAATAIAPLIDELVTSGAASVDRKGRVYCRRMVRAAAVSQKRSDAGKIGAAVTNWKAGDNSGLPGKTSGKQPDKPPDKRAASSRLPPSALQETFELWWAAYPRHVAKGAARKAYAVALKKADAATLLAGAVRAAERYAQTEQQFIPHPATWLNGERWLDEQSSAVVPPPADDRWEPRLRAYRADLDAGKPRPFWNEFWGPNPTQPNCDAPAEKLERYGFGKKAA